MTNLCEHALRNCDDWDMVDISIRNEVSVRNKALRISFRLKSAFVDVISNISVVTQSNSRFKDLDKFILEIHSVNMTAVFDRGVKTNGRPLATFTQLKKNCEVKV